MGCRWAIDDSTKPGPSQVGIPTTGLSFLDLPAEIRNEIYHLSCLKDDPVRLWRFQPPALARVNRQVRGEALSVFYGGNLFVVEISAPYEAFHWGGGDQQCFSGTFMLDPDPIADEVGVLRLSRGTTFSFEALGKSIACIKNLDVVLCYDPPRSSTGERPSYKMYHDIVVRLRSPSTSDGEATVSASREVHPERNTTYEAIYTADIERLATPAKASLTLKVAQAGFKGLTVSDLQELAETVLNIHLARSGRNRTGRWDTGQRRRDRDPGMVGLAQDLQKVEEWLN